MAVTADHVVVVGRGRLLADAPVQEIVGLASGTTVRVRSPQAGPLEELLRRQGLTVSSTEHGLLEVVGSTAPAIGDAAAAAGIALHELTPVHGSLEDAYLQLTADEVEYHADPAVAGGPRPGAPHEGAPDHPTRPGATAPTTEGALR
jgi:ABC-2 type transport system ATP-binding protein